MRLVCCLVWSVTASSASAVTTPTPKGLVLFSDPAVPTPTPRTEDPSDWRARDRYIDDLAKGKVQIDDNQLSEFVAEEGARFKAETAAGGCDRDFCSDSCKEFGYCLHAPDASCLRVPHDCRTRCTGCEGWAPGLGSAIWEEVEEKLRAPVSDLKGSADQHLRASAERGKKSAGISAAEQADLSARDNPMEQKPTEETWKSAGTRASGIKIRDSAIRDALIEARVKRRTALSPRVAMLLERGIGHVPEWDKKDIAELDIYIDNLAKGTVQIGDERFQELLAEEGARFKAETAEGGCARDFCNFECSGFAYCLHAPDASCLRVPHDCRTRCTGCEGWSPGLGSAIWEELEENLRAPVSDSKGSADQHLRASAEDRKILAGTSAAEPSGPKPFEQKADVESMRADGIRAALVDARVTRRKPSPRIALLLERAEDSAELDMSLRGKKTPAPTPAPTPFPDLSPHMPIADSALATATASIQAEATSTERAIQAAKQEFTNQKARIDVMKARVTSLSNSEMDARDKGLNDVDNLINEIAETVRTKDAYDVEVKEVRNDLKKSDKRNQKMRNRLMDAAVITLQGDIPPMQQDAMKMIKYAKRDMGREVKQTHRQLDRELDDLKDDEEDVEKQALLKFGDARRAIFRQASRIKDTAKQVDAFGKTTGRTLKVARKMIQKKIKRASDKAWNKVAKKMDRIANRAEKNVAKRITKFADEADRTIEGQEKQVLNDIESGESILQPTADQTNRQLKRTVSEKEQEAKELLVMFQMLGQVLSEVITKVAEATNTDARFESQAPQLVSGKETELTDEVEEYLKAATDGLSKTSSQLKQGITSDRETLAGKIAAAVSYVESKLREFQGTLRTNRQTAIGLLDGRLKRMQQAVAEQGVIGSSTVSEVNAAFKEQQKEQQAQEIALGQIHSTEREAAKDIGGASVKYEVQLDSLVRDMLAKWDQEIGKVGVKNSILNQAETALGMAKQKGETLVADEVDKAMGALSGAKEQYATTQQEADERLKGLLDTVGLGDAPAANALVNRVGEMAQIRIGNLKRSQATMTKRADRAVKRVEGAAGHTVGTILDTVEDWKERTESRLRKEIEKLAEEFTKQLKSRASKREDTAEKMKSAVDDMGEMQIERQRELIEQDENTNLGLQSIAEGLGTVKARQEEFAKYFRDEQVNVGDAAVEKAKQTILAVLKGLATPLQNKVKGKLQESIGAIQDAAKQAQGMVDEEATDKERKTTKRLEDEKSRVDAGLERYQSETSALEETSRQWQSEFQHLYSNVEGGKQAFEAALGDITRRAQALGQMTTKDLAKLHAMATAAFASGDEQLQEQMQRALGVSKEELHKIYEAGEKMRVAIESGNVAAVKQAEAALHNLYAEVSDTLELEEKGAKDMKVSLDGTYGEWKKGFADANQNIELLDQKRTSMEAQTAGDIKEAEQAENVMEERLEGGLAGLEGATTDMADNVTNFLDQEGKQSEQEAMLAESQLNSETQKLDGLLRSGFSQQDAADRALGRAVGDAMGQVDSVASQEGEVLNRTRLSEEEVQAVLEAEKVSLAGNEKTLKTYMGRTAGELLQILSQVLKKTYGEMHYVQDGKQKMESQAFGFKKLVDAMLASPAMQALLKIQKADQLAVTSSDDHGKLAYWMEAFENEAGSWRAGVDDVLGDQKDLLKKQDEENKAAQAQIEGDAKARSAALETQMGEKLGQLGGAGLSGIEADLVKSSKQAQATQNASVAQDRKYLGQISNQFAMTNDKAASDIAATGKEVDNFKGEIDGGMNVTEQIKAKLEKQEEENELLLQNEKGALKDQIKSFTSNVKSIRSPDAADSLLEVDKSCPSQWDRRRCRAPAPLADDPSALIEEDSMGALLHEAFKLQEEHENLNTRHEAAGKVIQQLMSTVTHIL